MKLLVAIAALAAAPVMAQSVGVTYETNKQETQVFAKIQDFTLSAINVQNKGKSVKGFSVGYTHKFNEMFQATGTVGKLTNPFYEAQVRASFQPAFVDYKMRATQGVYTHRGYAGLQHLVNKVNFEAGLVAYNTGHKGVLAQVSYKF